MISSINSRLLDFQIEPVSGRLKEEIQKTIDQKTKPLGALGRLEELALRTCLIQQTAKPQLAKPVMMVFAGDHGIVAEGVSPYPQEATYQMVYNFINGGAAINVFCRQNGIEVKIVDAGVNHRFPIHPRLIDAKVRMGTKNFAKEPAMNMNETRMAIEMAANLVDDVHNEGSNIIGFGEMGIGNTSSAAAIMHSITGLPMEACVGSGAGLDDAKIAAKAKILKQAVALHNISGENPLEVLSVYGGYEIAMMAGGMLKAAELKMIVLVDGFIASSAALIASQIFPEVLDYCIFAHASEEKGHAAMLEFLGVEPLLRLDMRLGEGSGAAVAYPIVEAAVNFMNEMATFDSAHIAEKRI